MFLYKAKKVNRSKTGNQEVPFSQIDCILGFKRSVDDIFGMNLSQSAWCLNEPVKYPQLVHPYISQPLLSLNVVSQIVSLNAQAFQLKFRPIFISTITILGTYRPLWKRKLDDCCLWSHHSIEQRDHASIPLSDVWVLVPPSKSPSFAGPTWLAELVLNVYVLALNKSNLKRNCLGSKATLTLEFPSQRLGKLGNQMHGLGHQRLSTLSFGQSYLNRLFLLTTFSIIIKR